MSSKIIGVCGFIGCGKGTVSTYLQNTKQFQQLSFAAKLKDAVSELFDWPRDMLEGDTKESRAWREVPDEFWTREFEGTDLLKVHGSITPRLVLQIFGTECMRNGFHEDVWTLIVKKQILECQKKDRSVVLADARFQNEIDMLHELGGEIWHVQRGEKPKWWDTAIHTNKLMQSGINVFADKRSGTMPVDYPEVHISEWNWILDENIDRVVKNDQDLEYLYHAVDQKLD